MSKWEIIVSSTRLPTSSTTYKCFINISRDISEDTVDGIAARSAYLFQLYLVRDTTAKIASNKWTVQYGVTGYTSSGAQTIQWPFNLSGITMQANIPEQMFTFAVSGLNNDGTAKTVTISASREAGVPLDFNVAFAFNTPKRYTSVPAPTNVRWVSHALSSGEVELAWDGSDNVSGYYVNWFLNNKYIGRVRIKYPICLRNDIDDILNPTDVLHARIQAVSETGDVSNSVASPQLRYGDMAKIKIDSSWLHSQPYVKPLGSSNFKPVRAVWIKTTDGWVRALDD